MHSFLTISPSPFQQLDNLLKLFKELCKSRFCIIMWSLIEPAHEIAFPSSYFAGTANRDGCGKGMVLKLIEDHFFLLRLRCGSNKNSSAELLALQGLLSFATMKNIQSLRAYGDSKVIVDWEIHASTFQVMMLDHWCSSTRSLLESFNGFSIKQNLQEIQFSSKPVQTSCG